MNTKSVKPTFGISFGLPHQGGGGYPINLHGPNPLVNPYGGSVGSAGINLGLISINPLVSVQIEKDDYGQKVVKPFVNLHVTPNDYLVHKLEGLLAYKKDAIFNKHQHFHHHHGPHKYHHYHHHKPHYFHGPPKPHYVSKPVYYTPPPEIVDPEPDLPHEYAPPLGTTYYDDPLNYGSGGSYDDGLVYGRTDEQQNTYDLNENDPTHVISRRGKSLPSGTPSNPIRFPATRKKRDVTDKTTVKVRIKK